MLLPLYKKLVVVYIVRAMCTLAIAWRDYLSIIFNSANNILKWLFAAVAEMGLFSSVSFELKANPSVALGTVGITSYIPASPRLSCESRRQGSLETPNITPMLFDHLQRIT